MKILQIHPWIVHKILWFALKIASITAASAHVISKSILNLCDVPRGALMFISFLSVCNTDR